MKYQHIGRDPNLSFNQPIILGTRLIVFDIVTTISYNGIEDYIVDFNVDKASVIEAINYCADLECQKSTHGNFCHGCVLRAIKDGWKVNKNDFQEITIDGEKFLKYKDNDSIYLGSIEDYEEDSFGRMGWKIAEEVKEKYNV